MLPSFEQNHPLEIPPETSAGRQVQLISTQLRLEVGAQRVSSWTRVAWKRFGQSGEIRDTDQRVGQPANHWPRLAPTEAREQGCPEANECLQS
jgi:hypothetical protein